MAETENSLFTLGKQNILKIESISAQQSPTRILHDLIMHYFGDALAVTNESGGQFYI